MIQTVAGRSPSLAYPDSDCLLSKLLKLGAIGCKAHQQAGEPSCIVEMVRLAVARGVVDFADISSVRLEAMIDELRVPDRPLVRHLLASAPGSPLPRP